MEEKEIFWDVQKMSKIQKKEKQKNPLEVERIGKLIAQFAIPAISLAFL